MRSHIATLVTLLVAAAITLIGGTRLAERETYERRIMNRELISKFVDELQGEVIRLEGIYQQDLAEVAAGILDNDSVLNRKLCERYCGITGYLILPLEKSENQPSVTKVASGVLPQFPKVRFLAEGQNSELETNTLYLKAADTVRLNSQGWIYSPNSSYTAFWWRRKNQTATVLLLDPHLITERINSHLITWSTAPFYQMRSADGIAAVITPEQEMLFGSGVRPSRPAELNLPAHNRFGVWQMSVWDRFILRKTYDSKIVFTSLVFSGILALLAFIVFRQQRHAHLLAEQRVSFVNRVSHELGTPLTNALLNLDLASESLTTSPEEARSRLNLVTEEVQRLARLVANVLTFSRKERGMLRIHRRPCVPDDVLKQVVEQFGPALARREVQVEFEVGAKEQVMIDADALAQVVGNLVSNVEKYASCGKYLVMRSTYLDNSLTVRVEDRGPGIPQSEQINVFRPFQRVSSGVNEGTSGTGLGLAIAKELAERMDGKLLLVESSERGSTFELKVPAERAIKVMPNPNRSVA